MNRYGLPKSLPQNHFRRKSYRLSASAEMDTTRHSFGCYGHAARSVSVTGGRQPVPDSGLGGHGPRGARAYRLRPLAAWPIGT